MMRMTWNVRSLTVLLVSLYSVVAGAVEISASDEKIVLEGAQKLTSAYDNKDVETISKMTLPTLVEMAGGEMAFQVVTLLAIDELRAAGVRIESTELSVAPALVQAKEHIVAVVRKVTFMKMPGKRGKSSGFLLAAKKSGEATWKYMDGAGLRKNPQMIYILLPGFPVGYSLPGNDLEILP